MSEHIVRPGLSWTQVSHLRCLIAMGFDNGTVTFRIDHTPCTESRYNLNGQSHLASYNKTPKWVIFWGHVGFRPEKKVCLPTQLGACSHPTGRSTVPYWCTIDVRTPWARHSVPTGPPGPRRAPTAARRPSRGLRRTLGEEFS